MVSSKIHRSRARSTESVISRKSYGSETEAICPFSGEAAGHKHGSMQHRKVMWQDQYSATWCSPTVQAVYSKQAENLSVGKTKSYGSGPLLVIRGLHLAKPKNS